MTPREPGEHATDHELVAMLSLDGGAGPAQPLGRDAEDALVRGVLDTRQTAVAAPAWSLARYAAAALILLGLSTSASAAVWWYMAKPSAPSAQPRAEPRPPVHERAAPPPERAPRELESAPPAPETRPKVKPTASPERARDLLAEANALRQRADYASASARYAEAARLAPRSLTAHAAELARGDLLLEQLGRARDALGAYRAAQRAAPDGPLAADARLGEARALGALGDTAGERRVLEALVVSAPGTSAGVRAARRLAEPSR